MTFGSGRGRGVRPLRTGCKTCSRTDLTVHTPASKDYLCGLYSGNSGHGYGKNKAPTVTVVLRELSWDLFHAGYSSHAFGTSSTTRSWA